MSSVTKYQIFCNDENINVIGWDVSPLTYCPHNNQHSIDLQSVVSLETIGNSNSIKNINKYRIYCNTESKFVEGWGNLEPTKCYNNTEHVVNLNSIKQIDNINNSQVKIIEDNVFVGRNVSIAQINLSSVSTTQTKVYTFKKITSMYSFKYATDVSNQGDELTIAINPNTPLGLITQNVSTGDTIIYAPPAIFLFGQIGFNVKLSNGVNVDDLGEILSIDSTAGTITVENPAVNNFSTTNTLCLMTYYTMKNIVIGPPQMYAFGEDIIGGAAVPVGTSVHFIYKNNSPGGSPEKSLQVYISLLF